MSDDAERPSRDDLVGVDEWRRFTQLVAFAFLGLALVNLVSLAYILEGEVTHQVVEGANIGLAFLAGASFLMIFAHWIDRIIEITWGWL